ncbi:MAG: ubiquinol-cytochrome C chaperone family protein [Pseudomonadota bacterium]
MLTSWFKRSPTLSTAKQLYGSIVTQARVPAFYIAHGVPDTMEGRYEMVALHLFLVSDRLRSTGEAGQRLGQQVMEVFITDMDDAMREIGVGDLKVPKKVKQAYAGLEARFEGYRDASVEREPDLALIHHVHRFVYAHDAAPKDSEGPHEVPEDERVGAAGIAAYLGRARAHLQAMDDTAVLGGTISFPAA